MRIKIATNINKFGLNELGPLQATEVKGEVKIS
jgi:hypothetical protein